jgi:SPP1 gp7 family putative phage head morphogenesis protein
VAEWAATAIDGEHELVSTLWRADMQTNLGGQLFVRDVELGGRKVALAPDIYDRAFLDLDFPEALDYFESRELMAPGDFVRLLDTERMRAWSLSRGISETVVRDAAERIRKAMGPDGPGLGAFIEALTGSVDADDYPGGVRRYLEMVFRTTTSTSYAAGRLTQQSDPDVAAAFADGGWMYLTADDNRVRSSHVPLNGKQWRYSDPDARRAYPPLGYQCFDGSTMVSGDVLWVSRARYTGQFVELRTDSGRVLTVTEHHPLATESGFKAACEIAEGEYLLTEPGHVDGALAEGAHVEDAPVRIEDLWNALCVRHGSAALRVSADDLHGDAVGVKGDVEVVAVNRALLSHIQADGLERASKRVLVGSTARLSKEVGHSGLPLCSLALGRAAARSPGRSALPLDGSGRTLDALPLESLRLAPAACPATDSDATNDRIAGHSESLAERQDALPSGVRGGDVIPRNVRANPIRLGRHASGHQRLADALVTNAHSLRNRDDAESAPAQIDRVVSVKIFPSSRHVFDLQTSSGILAANGIYASNCRCAMIVLDAEDLDPTAVSRFVDLDRAITPGFGQSPIATIESEGS